jgi:hypothetical protein
MGIEAFGLSEIGPVRPINEDCFISAEDLQLFVVVDGMGGDAGGEMAAKVAAESIERFIRRSQETTDFSWPYGIDAKLSYEGNRLKTAVNLGNRRIHRLVENHDDYLGTSDTGPRRDSPDQIGRYRIVEPIGRGAMGMVYRARDEAMDRDVAVKVMMADLEDDSDIRTRFHREAQAAARLSHPNIITIFDVGEDGNRLYMVMELLRGTTLKDFVRPLPASSSGRQTTCPRNRRGETRSTAGRTFFPSAASSTSC